MGFNNKNKKETFDELSDAGRRYRNLQASRERIKLIEEKTDITDPIPFPVEENQAALNIETLLKHLMIMRIKTKLAECLTEEHIRNLNFQRFSLLELDRINQSLHALSSFSLNYRTARLTLSKLALFTSGDWHYLRSNIVLVLLIGQKFLSAFLPNQLLSDREKSLLEDSSVQIELLSIISERVSVNQFKQSITIAGDKVLRKKTIQKILDQYSKSLSIQEVDFKAYSQKDLDKLLNNINILNQSGCQIKRSVETLHVLSQFSQKDWDLIEQVPLLFQVFNKQLVPLFLPSTPLIEYQKPWVDDTILTRMILEEVNASITVVGFCHLYARNYISAAYVHQNIERYVDLKEQINELLKENHDDDEIHSLSIQQYYTYDHLIENRFQIEDNIEKLELLYYRLKVLKDNHVEIKFNRFLFNRLACFPSKKIYLGDRVIDNQFADLVSKFVEKGLASAEELLRYSENPSQLAKLYDINIYHLVKSGRLKLTEVMKLSDEEKFVLSISDICHRFQNHELILRDIQGLNQKMLDRLNHPKIASLLDVGFDFKGLLLAQDEVFQKIVDGVFALEFLLVNKVRFGRVVEKPRKSIQPRKVIEAEIAESKTTEKPYAERNFCQFFKFPIEKPKTDYVINIEMADFKKCSGVR